MEMGVEETGEAGELGRMKREDILGALGCGQGSHHILLDLTVRHGDTQRSLSWGERGGREEVRGPRLRITFLRNFTGSLWSQAAQVRIQASKACQL